TNPIPIKVAMALTGIDCGPLRLPMTDLSTDDLQSLKVTLKNYGLL
ncbi:MAG TPA: 4-hydroxy-tetrahydrodipicolinate synthase, partial [Fuerstia sp.]|nr:4-hydroxy-tetrahydrodipicolinate synthase [Fuerstiella sp.]